jgi:cell division protein FtsL
LDTNELIILGAGLLIAVAVSLIAAQISTRALIETILQEIERHRHAQDTEFRP